MPFTSTRATPSTRSKRRRTVWSASSDNSLVLRAFFSSVDINANDTTGCDNSLSKRFTRGAFTSFGKLGANTATLSRTS